MTNLILDMQKDAMYSQIKVSDLLRKTLVVATKLGIEDLKEWADNELNGYDSEPIPKYRNIVGEIKAKDPYQGWIPVIFDNPEVAEKLSNRKIGQSVSELEHLMQGSRAGESIVMPLPQNIIDKLSRGQGIVPYLTCGKAQIAGILDSVRNIILQWSLTLEKDGIIGEDVSFSEKEKSIASTITYNINQFTGVLGDVSTKQMQIGDYNTIHSELKQLGVSQSERNELEEILDTIQNAKKGDKKTLISRGFEWLKRNGKIIGSLADTIKGWLESVA